MHDLIIRHQTSLIPDQLQRQKLLNYIPAVHTAVGKRTGIVLSIEFNKKGRLTGRYLVKFYDYTNGYWISVYLIYAVDPFGQIVLLKQFPPRYSRMEH